MCIRLDSASGYTFYMITGSMVFQVLFSERESKCRDGRKEKIPTSGSDTNAPENPAGSVPAAGGTGRHSQALVRGSAQRTPGPRPLEATAGGPEPGFPVRGPPWNGGPAKVLARSSRDAMCCPPEAHLGHRAHSPLSALRAAWGPDAAAAGANGRVAQVCVLAPCWAGSTKSSWTSAPGTEEDAPRWYAEPWARRCSSCPGAAAPSPLRSARRAAARPLLLSQGQAGLPARTCRPRPAATG